MPEFLSLSRARSILACTVLLSTVMLANGAFAQAGPPGPPPQPGQNGLGPNPMCVRLEGQLVALDRGGGGGDPAREDQIRRYQDSQAKQQAELDRVTMQAKRMGCDSSGFFSLFNGQSAQCGPVNTQIQQMRANLDQITGNLERLRGGGPGGFSPERDNQRRSVLAALAQNNCGPQYANAAQSQGGGNFLNNLFGGGGNNPNNPQGVPPSDLGPQSGTYRTVCVRTCDGAYFPVSFATVPARFPDDEKTCKALCPGRGSRALHSSQSRRGHELRGLHQRPALHGAADRVQIPQRVQPVLLLQGRRPDLGRRAEIRRRQGGGRAAG
ncbi:hypothetical protein ACVWXQ_009784 [Bradyrhizobium sp. S3.14.4]